MGGREEEWENQGEEWERPAPQNSRTCVFVSVLQSHRCLKCSSVEVLPWTPQTSFKSGAAEVKLFQTEIKCEGQSLDAGAGGGWESSGTPGLLWFAVELAVIISALAPNLPAAPENGLIWGPADGWSGGGSSRNELTALPQPSCSPSTALLINSSCLYRFYVQEKRFTPPTRTHPITPTASPLAAAADDYREAC